MKIFPIALLMLSPSFASAGPLKFDFLYVDTTVNKELHALLYPIPDKYSVLEGTVISHSGLDSLARDEMGNATVFKISGQSLKGKHLTVGKDGVAFGENLVPFGEIDYIQYGERKTFAGFLGTVAGVAFFSALVFGGLETSNLVFRGEYDYKNVLAYSGYLAGCTVLFYFPLGSTHRIGFKFK